MTYRQIVLATFLFLEVPALLFLIYFRPPKKAGFVTELGRYLRWSQALLACIIGRSIVLTVQAELSGREAAPPPGWQVGTALLVLFAVGEWWLFALFVRAKRQAQA